MAKFMYHLIIHFKNASGPLHITARNLSLCVDALRDYVDYKLNPIEQVHIYRTMETDNGTES